MYYWNSAGGWNKTHGQVEQATRIDSFEYYKADLKLYAKRRRQKKLAQFTETR